MTKIYSFNFFFQFVSFGNLLRFISINIYIGLICDWSRSLLLARFKNLKELMNRNMKEINNESYWVGKMRCLVQDNCQSWGDYSSKHSYFAFFFGSFPLSLDQEDSIIWLKFCYTLMWVTYNIAAESLIQTYHFSLCMTKLTSWNRASLLFKNPKLLCLTCVH